jgi:predicted Zn-ribbon and HTH transcriptional regulator
MTECKVCGYRWNGSKKSHHCPGCKSEHWNEEPQGDSCELAGGVCDICGCEFKTLLLQDHYCPNCGSKRWDHKATDSCRRLEDLHPWVMEKVKGGKIYHYWMASWREGDKVRNVHLGSCKRLDANAALQKARAIKAEALGVSQ